MSSFRTSGIESGSSAAPFLILLVATDAGRKSATAADMTTASASTACFMTASRISSAVRTRTTSTAAGSGRSDTAPATSVTWAPRWAARRAIA